MLTVYGLSDSGNCYKVRLALEDGACLPESNAILDYLAEGAPLLPQDRLGRVAAQPRPISMRDQ